MSLSCLVSSGPTGEIESTAMDSGGIYGGAFSGMFARGFPQGPPGTRKALTDVLCKDDAGQAGRLGQTGLHHRLLGALLLVRAQRLDAGHLWPG